MDNVFNQASFKQNVWQLVVTIMDLFEEGELKDQSLNTKALMTKPEFRQQYLSPIQCLPDAFKLEVLQQVVDGDLSLMELRDKAAEYRSLRTIERAFCKYVEIMALIS